MFATQPIVKGTLVWSFTPGFDLETDIAALEGLTASLQEWLLHYGYIDKRLNKFVLCCDDARYLNHSPLPNIAHGVDIASRDIEVGEETDCRLWHIRGWQPAGYKAINRLR